MIFALKRHSIYLLLFTFFILKNSYALESLSYSGRLVQTNGAPVTGTVNLRAELAYTNNLSTVLCSDDISGVVLSKGVFHVKLDFTCTGGKTLTQVLSQVPANESVAIQITDVTNSKSYSFQAIHAIPYANVSSVAVQLEQNGAADGEFLKWDNSTKKWKPGTVSGASGGTVTNVSVNSPLTISNPTSTPAITLPQANTTTDGYLSNTDWNTFNNKQPAIAAGTTAQYYRGDKTWQTLDTSVVPENVANLYFTNARALGVPLTGFSASSGAITATDSILSAFEKTQGQINSIGTASNNYLLKNSSDSITGAVNVGITGALTITNSPALPTDAVNKQYADTKLNLTGGTLSGDLNLDTQLKLKGASNYVSVKAHATTGTYNFILPQTAGTNGHVLQTDGSGNTSWVTPSIGSSNITDGSIVDADINASAAIAQSKIANLTSDLSTINTSISGINTTLSGLTTTSVSEGTNKYYTDTRAIAAPLTGFAVGTDTAIVAADTTLQAFEKSQGQLNNRVKKNGDTMSGILSLDSDLKIKGGSNYVTLRGHATSAAYNFIFPQNAGTNGFVLSTDGAGNLSWINPSTVTAGSGTVDSSSIANGSIVDADVNASAAIAQSKIANLTTDLAAKEPTITAGTAAQYWKGNKTWSSLQTDVQALVLSGFTTGSNSSVVNTDTVSGAFGKVQGQIDAINTAVAGKEASLTAGTTAQFYRGDKSWQTLNGAAVANTPAGAIAATTTQNAINELDTEKQDKLTATSSVLSNEVRFYELPGNGSFYTSLKSPDDLTANINYVLPVTAPTAGQVLSSSAAGVMSWITIPSAPVSTVFGRSGAVAAANGDYTASQVTNVPAGTIAATTVQAALNELDTDKQGVIAAGTTAQYYRGDKTWATFSTDAINSVLASYAVGTGTKPAVTNTDTIVGAFGKVQKNLNDIDSDYVSKTANNTVTGSFNISGITSFIQVPTPTGAVVNEAANVDYVQTYVGGFGQWSKSGSDIYRNGGNVGIGTTSPLASSLLELNSTTKGFSPPRMTLAQRNAIASPTQGLFVFNTTDSTLDYYNGSAWLALNGSPKYMKLVMSAYQTVDNASIIAFDSIASNSGMTKVGNGIQLKAGVTYRIESAINTISASGLNYLGYVLHNGTANVGHVAYSDEGENTNYGFKAPIVEIYKPTVDVVISVKVTDDNIGTGQVTNNYNTFLMVTELVPSGPGGGGSDNMGNHTASQNIVLGSNWLSGDGGSEGLSVDSSGNVGIATAAPAAKLHVVGTTLQEGSTTYAYNGTVGTSWIGASNNVWGQPYLHIGGETSGGVRRLGLFADHTYASGNLSVGSTTANYRLDVAGAIGLQGQLNFSSPVSGWYEFVNRAGTAQGFRFYSGASGTGGNVVIDGSGNVGIGTTAPGGNKLAVLGGTTNVDYLKINAQDGSLEGGEMQFAGAGANGPIQIDNYSGHLRVHTLAAGKNLQVLGGGVTVEGNIGIGTHTPGYRLDVQGTIRGFGITDSSDIRLKKEIKPLANDLEKINKIQGVSYFWKDTEKNGEKKQIGFIAQALEKIYPELVATDKEGMKSVNYSHMVAPLVEAVKSLYNRVLGIEEKLNQQERNIASKADKALTDAKIQKLEAENAKLKKENDLIKARLDRIEKALNSK